jgi:hypothetical protein
MTDEFVVIYVDRKSMEMLTMTDTGITGYGAR